MRDWPNNLSVLQLRRGANDTLKLSVALHLGDLLNSGHLALFLGTGISNVVGLPLWTDLNNRIVKCAPSVLKSRFPTLWNDDLKHRLPKIKDLRAANADPLRILDKVEAVCSCCDTLSETGMADKDRYVGDGPSWQLVVRQALYGGRTRYEFDEMFHPELVSLCSLMTALNRGSVREVVTFNYDDLPESYLRLHGHRYHVITPVPNELRPNDCTLLYHPHGYLPCAPDGTTARSSLILSQRSYDRVASGTGDHARRWCEFISWALNISVGLFVGISGNDNIFRLYFDKALELGGQVLGRRALAFAILVGQGYLNPDEWLRRRVVPLEFKDANEVAKFLALICENAGGPAGLR